MSPKTAPPAWPDSAKRHLILQCTQASRPGRCTPTWQQAVTIWPVRGSGLHSHLWQCAPSIETAAKGCRYCGLCLHGCPYDSRYSAKTTLARLVLGGKVGYLPGVIVEKLSSANGRINIEVRSLAGDSVSRFPARRVLVGAGLLETSRMVLASLRLYDVPVVANHSDIFTLPVGIRRQGSKCRRRLITIRPMKTSGKTSTDLAHGKAGRAALEYGIDLAQLDASLALTPLERVILHDHALPLILAMKTAGIEHYGFDPGLAETVERT